MFSLPQSLYLTNVGAHVTHSGNGSIEIEILGLDHGAKLLDFAGISQAGLDLPARISVRHGVEDRRRPRHRQEGYDE
jgi:hypothetical protein